MKKFLKGILAITMMVAASGCASNEMTDTTSATKATEDTQTMAEDLVDTLENAYEDDDHDAFADCFLDEDDPTVDMLWDMFDNDDPTVYDNSEVIVVTHDGDLYGISEVNYDVDGDFPDTDMDSMSYALAVKNVDGEFKVDGSQESVDAIDEAVLDDENIVPDDFVSAYNDGRNVVDLDASNYLFLGDNPVYKGTSQNFVKFVWQEEDGSLGIEILVQNGTDQDIHYSDGTITLTDSSLSEIGEWDIDVDETVPAGECRRYDYTIDASEVNIGTQTWNELSADCDLNFD